MDFQELLLQADKNHKIAAKQSQQVKRLNTHFTAPAKKETKSNQPKSEVVQKLMQEKEREKQQRKEAEEKERRRKERAKEEREREEKHKNAFRIPKKEATKDPPSDAESFSSISSDDGEETNTHFLTNQSSNGEGRKSSHHALREKSHKSSSHDSSSGRKDKHSSLEKSSSKHSSHHSSKHVSSGKSEKDGHRSSENKKHSSSDKNKHLSSDRHKHSSSDKHKHSSSDKHKHSSSDKQKHSSEKPRSGNSESSSTKDRSRGDHSSHKSHSSSLKEKPSKTMDNDSSGYITSPNLSSEEEEEEEAPSKRPAAQQRRHSTDMQRRDSTNSKKEESADPVTLTRHHLKPTLDRQGCSLDARNQMLAKLQAIRDKMGADDDRPFRKRAAPGEVKKRRAKREKLEGDFTGSCMEKIDYDLEEKPSLKRPEPKPEEPKPQKEKKPEKRAKERLEKSVYKKHYDKHKVKSDSSKFPSKVNRFDAMQEKPKSKPKPRPRPPPVNFADLMKMAEQKQVEPVMVETAPKKEKERRPMTQEEIDRQRTREERLKTKEYKDWYKYGEKGGKKEQTSSSSAKDTSQSGGFLSKHNQVIPSTNGPSQSKPTPSSHGRNESSSNRQNTSHASSSHSRPSTSQTSASRQVPGFRQQPHPTRPGMIANKPQAMAQHFNNGHKSSDSERSGDERRRKAASPDPRSQGSSRSAPSQPRSQPSGSVVDKTRGGNAWDSLFTRPEYKTAKAPPASKKRGMVIDSEEEDYDDDMDDFIDDEGEEDMDTVSGTIRQLFGYDKRKFRDEDFDDRSMEVGFSQLMKEEARSARLGRQEDLEDIRREEEELRQKALKKKMRR